MCGGGLSSINYKYENNVQLQPVLFIVLNNFLKIFYLNLNFGQKKLEIQIYVIVVFMWFIWEITIIVSSNFMYWSLL